MTGMKVVDHLSAPLELTQLVAAVDRCS